MTKYRKYRRMRWAGHVARIGTIINVDRTSAGKLEGKRPLWSEV
jgi:hypothetical protein